MGGPTGKRREHRRTVTLPSWQRPSPQKNEISTLALRSIREKRGDTQGTSCLSVLSSPEVAGQLEEPDFALPGTQCPKGRSGGWPPDPTA